MNVHYAPTHGRAGDVIPLWGGPSGQEQFHVFYLKTPQNAAEEAMGGTAWHHLVSSDCVIWTDLGEAIERGRPLDQDASVATGSIVDHDGLFHAFTTGFSEQLRDLGRPEQGVLHATSPDLDSWTKDDSFTTLNAPDGYDVNDWRDPFVYFDERPERGGGVWIMLVAGQRETASANAGAPKSRRGVLAQYVSRDLQTWEHIEDRWAPNLTTMHECPDLFQIDSWWYLVYSTFTERQVTRYHMARSPDGPWLAPDDDVFDDGGLYAAKTMAAPGGPRYLVGWCPTTDTGTDDGDWQWGGSIITHELRQRVDGTLGAVIPEPVRAAVARPFADVGQVALSSGDGFAWREIGDMPDEGTVTVRFVIDEASEVGLWIHADHDLESGYLIRIRPGLARLEFDRFPRPAMVGVIHERPLRFLSPDAAEMAGVDETVDAVAAPVVAELSLVWSGGTFVAQVADIVLTGRTHACGGKMAVFGAQGNIVAEIR